MEEGNNNRARFPKTVRRPLPPRLWLARANQKARQEKNHKGLNVNIYFSFVWRPCSWFLTFTSRTEMVSGSCPDQSVFFSLKQVNRWFANRSFVLSPFIAANGADEGTMSRPFVVLYSVCPLPHKSVYFFIPFIDDHVIKVFSVIPSILRVNE